MEIGIDIEENVRFENLSDHFLKRVYSENEIYEAKKRKNFSEFLCSLWCVKEATVKAFSNLQISFKNIEVKWQENGKPYIEKNEIIKNELKKVDANNIKISISHSKEYSTAVCLIY